MSDPIEPAAELPPPLSNQPPHTRWHFIRDVLAFQLKLIIGNIQNFVLVPVSLAAAALDLLIKGKRHGEKFYWVMEWGRRTDEMINVYSAIGGYHATGGENEHAMYGDYTVDSILSKVESAIVREYQKGGTAAITIPNVFQSNGVIQVVDSVLMPN